jgi:2,4-dienoyl-CoA reductase-like NADH-dependent reductase (Old Yellow Enzyme family)
VTSTEFGHLAQPLQLRHLTLGTRIVFGAHTANMSEAGIGDVVASRLAVHAIYDGRAVGMAL